MEQPAEYSKIGKFVHFKESLNPYACKTRADAYGIKYTPRAAMLHKEVIVEEPPPPVKDPPVVKKELKKARKNRRKREPEPEPEVE